MKRIETIKEAEEEDEASAAHASTHKSLGGEFPKNPYMDESNRVSQQVGADDEEEKLR